jgi:hypothetical protein
VERANRTLQDRLVKELRLEEVCDIRFDIERTVQVLRLGRGQREAFVEAPDEPGQESVTSIHIA